MASPRSLRKQIALLQSHSYEVLGPVQPSYNAKLATTTLQEDAAFIKKILSRLIDEEGKDVIVIMHSYSGMVGTEAVTEDMSKIHRDKKRLKGGVVKLLHMSAFLLHKGDSLATALGGELPPFIPIEADGTCNMLDPQHRFYNKLTPSEEDRWASMLKPHPASAQTTALTNEAYRYVSSTNLLCENDQALPLFVQEAFVRNAGVQIETETCTAGHSPFLSMPEKVVQVVEGLKW